MQFQVARVLVVDDQYAVRTGLSVFFDVYDDLVMVGEASNGEEAIASCARLQPDVVLMDLRMPVMDGITATRHIRKQFPHTQVLVLTTSSDAEQIHAAVKAGACGYVSKQATIERLAQALREAVRGRNFMPGRLRLPGIPESIPVAVQYAHLNAQWEAFIERRSELYQELEHLRQEEEAFFYAAHQMYLCNTLTSTSRAYSVEAMWGFRQQHTRIFDELREIRLGVERVRGEMRALKPFPPASVV